MRKSSGSRAPRRAHSSIRERASIVGWAKARSSRAVPTIPLSNEAMDGGHAIRRALLVRWLCPPYGLLRGHHVRPFGLAMFLELRLEPAPQPAVDAVEIDVDHRRDEQRQQLGHAEAADHGDAKRLTQFGAG